MLEALHLEVRGQRLDGGAMDHELAHRVHQGVEALGVDADGPRSAVLIGAAAGSRRLGGGGATSATAGFGSGAGVAVGEGAGAGTAIREPAARPQA